MAYELSDGVTGGSSSKRKRFRHPLSLPADSQWNNTISDEQQTILPGQQQPSTCVVTGQGGDWDASSHPSDSGGITVVHETIIHSTEKGR